MLYLVFTLFFLSLKIGETCLLNGLCGPEEGHGGLNQSPWGLWSGVSISRKALWLFCLSVVYLGEDLMVINNSKYS